MFAKFQVKQIKQICFTAGLFGAFNMLYDDPRGRHSAHYFYKPFFFLKRYLIIFYGILISHRPQFGNSTSDHKTLWGICETDHLVMSSKSLVYIIWSEYINGLSEAAQNI